MDAFDPSLLDAAPPLSEALGLASDGDGFTARLHPAYSNAPLAADPQRGAPFGGLMAALALRAARAGCAVDAPLQTLTVQYLAGARFEDIRFSARLLRGGRNVLFAAVEAGQADRPALSALATFGRNGAGPEAKPLRPSPTPFEALEPSPMVAAFAPWFTHSIEHRFDGGPRLFGRNTIADPTLRLWMRCRDAGPLDEARLVYLLDGIYPSYFTVLPAPPVLSSSIDLRADLLGPLTPEVSPNGWAIFEFTVRDVGGGWAVDDGAAFAPDGRPLALVRQRRKMLPQR
jgi:acyl-CoA thioesterase